MRVDKKDIFLDDEDECLAVECQLWYWDKKWEGARWMFLDSEWAEYVQGRVQIKRRLRKIKEKLGYDLHVAD